MRTSTKIGIVFIFGTITFIAGVMTEKHYSAFHKEPINDIVINDSILMCKTHQGLKQIKRVAEHVYDVQCKDTAVFHNLKLHSAPKSVNPAVLTLNEVIN